MKAGLVRIASVSLIAIGALGTAACNDDPLSFDNATVTQLAINPSVMALNSAGVQRLIVNTLNDGFEPTFDLPTATADQCGGSGSVTLDELPPFIREPGQDISDAIAVGAEPPSKWDVTGGNVGEACIIAAFGSLTDTIPVSIVPADIAIVGPDTIRDGDFTDQVYVVTARGSDSAAAPGFDITAPEVSVFLDDGAGNPTDTLIARIVSVASTSAASPLQGAAPGAVVIRRGPLGGDFVLNVDLVLNDITREGNFGVNVEKPVPAIVSITPTSGVHASTATIMGSQLSILPISGQNSVVLIDGAPAANVVSESPTSVVVQMPTFRAPTSVQVQVDVDGIQSNAVTWDQTDSFNPINCSPGCDLFLGGTAIPMSVPYDFDGAFNIGDVDNFWVFTVSRDINILMNLSWPGTQDVDLLVTDGAFTAFVCTDGATGANPEQSDCHTEDPGDYLYWIDLYAGSGPITFTNDGSVSAIN